MVLFFFSEEELGNFVRGCWQSFNSTLPDEQYTSDHARRFVNYLHNSGKGSLKQEVQLTKKAAKQELQSVKEGAQSGEMVIQESSAQRCRLERPNSFVRVQNFHRLLVVMVYVLTARWSIFLERNSGYGCTEAPGFLKERFYESPHRLTDHETWRFTASYRGITWAADMDWAAVAEWLFYCSYTGKARPFQVGVDFKKQLHF